MHRVFHGGFIFGSKPKPGAQPTAECRIPHQPLIPKPRRLADSAQSSRCDLSPHSLQTRTKSQYDASYIFFVTHASYAFSFWPHCMHPGQSPPRAWRTRRSGCFFCIGSAFAGIRTDKLCTACITPTPQLPFAARAVLLDTANRPRRAGCGHRQSAHADGAGVSQWRCHCFFQRQHGQTRLWHTVRGVFDPGKAPPSSIQHIRQRPMPWMVRLTWSGVAFHAGRFPATRHRTAAFACPAHLRPSFLVALRGAIRSGSPVRHCPKPHPP